MKIKITLGIGYVHNKEHIMEIDDEELEGYNEEETAMYLSEIAWDWANNCIDVGFEII
jgi:hypothetical protein